MEVVPSFGDDSAWPTAGRKSFLVLWVAVLLEAIQMEAAAPDSPTDLHILVTLLEISF